MKKTHKRAFPWWGWFVSACLTVVLVLASGYVVNALVRDDGRKQANRQVRRVTLLKPPPPPKIEQKQPEPEIERNKEEVEAKLEEEQAEDNPEAAAEGPEAGDLLGLDADGTAGSDGFGLVGKKGGRPLLSAGFGSNELLQRYAWYTRIVQDELGRKVREELDRNGGFPEGKVQAMVKVLMDEIGKVVDYRICSSSGHGHMDEAVSRVLGNVRISQPPPRGMLKIMKIRISSQG